MDITVLTPTYNRKEKIQKLYKSLCAQEDKEFLWLIVDDGSTDITEKIVKEFISDKIIKIEYIKKPNGGKHTALNIGIKNILTELTFIVDSDDWLTNDAIKKIKTIHSKYRNNKEICGYSFLRKFSNDKINGKYSQNNEIIDKLNKM